MESWRLLTPPQGSGEREDGLWTAIEVPNSRKLAAGPRQRSDTAGEGNVGYFRTARRHIATNKLSGISRSTAR